MKRGRKSRHSRRRDKDLQHLTRYEQNPDKAGVTSLCVFYVEVWKQIEPSCPQWLAQATKTKRGAYKELQLEWESKHNIEQTIAPAS